MGMKKLDRLVISSFIPPFVVTFMIAMFVLLMQTLWLYIDDIAGKGLGFFLLMELLAYRCVALIPMSLPLAILISSVMVLGNLAEYYELSSFKSAGVSLIRVMSSLIVFGAFTAVFSYVCSNNLIPIANLKFGSRMYDIQRQKPSLRIDEGVFNEDFQGQAIHIGNKKSDGRTIEDVLIYDHNEASRNRLSVVTAQSGEMYSLEDDRYFVMRLSDGHQYIEVQPGNAGNNNGFPFVRTTFKHWTKVFDLSEFDLNRTNEELFKQNRTMMSSGQLREAIDSIGVRIANRRQSFSNNFNAYFHYVTPDSLLDATKDSTSAQNAYRPDTLSSIQSPRPERDIQPIPATALANKTALHNPLPYRIYEQNADSLKSENGFYRSFGLRDRKEISSKAKTLTRGVLNQAESASRSIDSIREAEAKHIFELWTKFSMAVVCFIFVFIGAPMGAIVRKGGFGYPILVSIIFFMLFVVLTIFCRKIAETFVIPAAAAAWLPCAILFPIGLFLTYKAMNDAKVVNLTAIRAYISMWKRKYESGKTTVGQ